MHYGLANVMQLPKGKYLYPVPLSKVLFIKVINLYCYMYRLYVTLALSINIWTKTPLSIGL